MMRKILCAICFFLIWTGALPAYAADTRQTPPPSKVTEEDMKIVKVMEILDVMDMIENLDLLEDMDLLAEEKNDEKND